MASMTGTGKRARRKKRVFMWVFLVVQLLFITWIIVGLATTGHTEPSAAQMDRYCAPGSGSVLGLYHSRADCMNHYSHVLSDAAGAGRGLGIAVVVLAWVVVDFLLAVPYAIYRLARRPTRGS